MHCSYVPYKPPSQQHQRETVFSTALPLLHPEEQVFEAMLEGWSNQQVARNLQKETIKTRRSVVIRFAEFSGTYPWQWTSADFEDWISIIQSTKKLRASTLRSLENAVQLFCSFVASDQSRWTDVCLELFDKAPGQIVFEWNSVRHRVDDDGDPRRRALTPAELQTFFDVVDDETVMLQRQGRKGWIAAFRDSVAFKTTYGFGLRRREAAKLEIADFGTNPSAPEFREFGVLYVRWGKAVKGGEPRRRSVLATQTWLTDIIDEWVNDIRDLHPRANDSASLWPSERGLSISPEAFGLRFARYREIAGLPEALTLHALRHSYVTHLIEQGADAKFVQDQVGHAHASTTSIYTSVSSDFRKKTLRAMLDSQIERAMRTDF